MLSTHLNAPVVTETSVKAHLLHSLEILTESGVASVANQLREGSVLDAALSVKEPFGDAVVEGLRQDVVDLVHLCLSELSSATGELNLSDFADEVGEASSDTLDHSESEHDLVLAVHIRVLHSQNVSECACVF